MITIDVPVTKQERESGSWKARATEMIARWCSDNGFDQDGVESLPPFQVNLVDAVVNE